MRIGVVSDTHGSVDHTRPAVRMLESLDVDAVLHCGDIGSADVVRLLAAWPTHFVFGNCDYDTAELARAIDAAGQTCHGLFGELELAGVPIALLHSHERERFRDAIDSGRYRLVCYGHTHVAADDLRGDTRVLNPGALYRANPHTIAVVDLPAVEATIVPLQ
ncbi:MAG: YfcE family phosphodiesterase [Planctomycetota bacterium]